MKNEKLTAVTNKICELLKGSSLDPIKECSVKSQYEGVELTHKGVKITSPIREAEVLAALDKLNHGDAFIDMSGYLYYVTSDPHCEDSVLIKLGQPLSNQPTEVIEFLFNILVK